MFHTKFSMRGIVLSKKNFRERDQIVSILSLENGKVDLLARGIKKIISKNSAGSEPFNLVEFDFAPGREINYLTTIVPIRYFSDLKSSYDRRIIASIVTSVLDKYCETNSPDGRLFELYYEFLSILDEVELSIPNYFVDVFVLRFLDLEGYGFVVDRCVVSGESLGEIRKYIFEENSSPPQISISLGGIVSPSVKSDLNDSFVDTSFAMVDTLYMFKNLEWSELLNIPCDENVYNSLHNIIYDFYKYHIESSISDWRSLL